MAPHDVRAGTIGTSRAPGSVTGKHLRRDFLSTTSRAQLPYGGRSHSALTRPQRASWPASYPHAGAETTVRTVAVDAPALVTLARSPASAAARVFYSSFCHEILKHREKCRSTKPGRPLLGGNPLHGTGDGCCAPQMAPGALSTSIDVAVEDDVWPRHPESGPSTRVALV